MEEPKVYEYARYHLLAVLAGDRKAALDDVVPDARPQAEEVFQSLPGKVDEGEVMDMTPEGDQYMVAFNFTGGEADVVIETAWAERDGKPMIVAMRLA